MRATQRSYLALRFSTERMSKRYDVHCVAIAKVGHSGGSLPRSIC